MTATIVRTSEAGRSPGDSLPDPDDLDDRSVPEAVYAGYRPRALAFGVDIAAPVGVLGMVGALGYTRGNPAWSWVLLALTAVAVVGFLGWNRVWVPGSTGRTVGRRAAGIIAVRATDRQPMGRGRGIGRAFAHLIADTGFVLLGWLRPVQGRRQQTLLDRLTGVAVVIDPDDGRTRPRLPMAVLAAVTIMAAALACLIYFDQYRPDRDAEGARADITQIGAESAERLLTYGPGDAKAKLESATELLTGDFRDYYRQFTQQVVVPAAAEKQVNTQAHVVGSAIEHLGPGNATLLLIIDQTTTTVANPAPTATQSAVRMELVRVDDSWLVAAFEPIF